MNNNLSLIGLTPEVVLKIQQVFEKHPEIDRVCLYGSRAKGDFRNGSDIDLSIMSDTLSFSCLMEIENELDDLLLPYKIDLSLYRKIENNELTSHIQRVGIEFYQAQRQNDSSIMSTKQK